MVPYWACHGTRPGLVISLTSRGASVPIALEDFSCLLVTRLVACVRLSGQTLHYVGRGTTHGQCIGLLN